ncbi:DUF2889 domain-containing protein [Blastomonas sp.]|uniref:DUF2889 domain-containing protein n=1 Tax=Blastomonas sp. TaxID=1909299 RepID=UPI00406A8F33
MPPNPNAFRQMAQALNRPGVRQPARRPNSVRRTSSHQSIWVPGNERGYTIHGRARDLRTDAGPHPVLIGEASVTAEIGPDGRLDSLSSNETPDPLGEFAGLRPGGELRKAVATAMPHEGANDTLLHRLLDDLAGAAFMSTAAWYAWEGGIEAHAQRAGVPVMSNRVVTGVCLSHVRGSPALTEDGRGADDNADHPLGPLPLASPDPFAFHRLADADGPNQSRLRRTDIWMDEGELVADAWFQDSSAVQGETLRRIIFHEYGIVARFDAATLALKAIAVTPYVLPYVSCHAAPATANVLIGKNARELRNLVPMALKGIAGCTHLNDMLRALQDVAGLAAALADLAPDRERIAPASIAD